MKKRYARLLSLALAGMLAWSSAGASVLAQQQEAQTAPEDSAETDENLTASAEAPEPEEAALAGDGAEETREASPAAEAVSVLDESFSDGEEQAQEAAEASDTPQEKTALAAPAGVETEAPREKEQKRNYGYREMIWDREVGSIFR